MATNPFIVEDKQCTIHVLWVTDPSETGERERGRWHQPHTVSFRNGSDLVKKLQRMVPAERWLQVFMTAQDMAPEFPDAELNEHGDTIDQALEDRRFAWSVITSHSRAYTDTGERTLTDFPGRVDEYCTQCVALKRRLFVAL
jgi:hypothetical protein